MAIEVAAENATELPILGNPRMKLRMHASHTTPREERRKLLAILYASHLGEGGDRGGRTGTNRGAPASVDFVEKLRPWDSAVAAKGIHHA